MQGLATIKYFVKSHPRDTALVTLALTAAGLMEALGLMTLLPLIGLMTGETGIMPPALAHTAGAVFDALGISTSLLPLLAFIAIVMTAKAVLIMLAMTQVARSSADVITDLRLSFLRGIMKARWSYYQTLSAGGSAHALGAESLRTADVFRQVGNMMSFLIVAFVYTVMAFAVSWPVSVAALGAGFLLLFLFAPMIGYARHYGQEQTRLMRDSARVTTDALGGIKPILAMNRGAPYVHYLEHLTENLRTAQFRQIVSSETLKFVSEPVMVILLAAGLYFVLSYSGLGVSQVLFMAFLFHRLASRLLNAQKIYQNIAINESALFSLLDIISKTKNTQENWPGHAAPSFEKNITFKDVQFSYGTADVLSGLSLTLDAGKFHALTGVSGSGKTTLVDLVCGLHRPAAGRVFVDGADLQSINISAWRRMIGYVPQDVVLFNDTVFHNVTLGDSSFTRRDVHEALALAGAADFVAAMEHGIDTPVGERGMRLSGGQRQRIAIARALVHKPKLLILDEATSALDAETEAAILKTVSNLAGTVTILAITHGEAALDFADHLIRIEQGRIVQDKRKHNRMGLFRK